MHKGEGCFIIGNGPSLKTMDLKPLKDYHTFGLNKIYLIFDRVDLNLSYHVAVNPLVIEQSAREFESLVCPSFLSYRDARYLVRNLEHIYFIAWRGPITFQEDITKEIHGSTVTYIAMQIAYYMGFSKVFLIGVDHNFKVMGNPNEKQFLVGEDVNHFDPKYFSSKEWHLPDLEASELDYHLARFYFSRSGRQIYDSTVGGKLQIFQKISYEKALEMCGKKLIK
ncbi:MAG: hypothetical protein A2Y97_05005 [Nitrospirae bacterium RBG_13_39_12]|nr:MAG: hypothetical protein A2Y97_05005 [Nitrospirae bacterium RBG_13_39_12]